MIEHVYLVNGFTGTRRKREDDALKHLGESFPIVRPWRTKNTGMVTCAGLGFSNAFELKDHVPLDDKILLMDFLKRRDLHEEYMLRQRYGLVSYEANQLYGLVSCVEKRDRTGLVIVPEPPVSLSYATVFAQNLFLVTKNRRFNEPELEYCWQGSYEQLEKPGTAHYFDLEKSEWRYLPSNDLVARVTGKVREDE
ncbi:hypothetical protein COV18_04105 [Candidatus Woesearchaeota archaeon CG10_big_fil_rev_8_21_14_0_10_37_12]|nr:MAG: hypothetical protein COV18_04105 [Candidatus Woesearchaeota archaeon CG10_big_fil_rev_8_21_14_0_10_37_12]